LYELKNDILRVVGIHNSILKDISGFTITVGAQITEYMIHNLNKWIMDMGLSFDRLKIIVK
jgi:hypothetical protein